MTTFSYIPPASSQASQLDFVRPTYYVRSFTGFGASNIDTHLLRAAFQHGATLTAVRLAQRDLRLGIRVSTSSVDDMWTTRTLLSETLNPLDGAGTLRRVTPGGVSRDIPAQPLLPRFAPTQTSAVWDVEVALLCPYPFFHDPSQNSQNFGSAPNSISLTNDGQIPAPFEAEFNGPVTNPSLTIGSSVIKLERALPSGETITVTTGPGAPSTTREVSGVETDASRFLSSDSNLVLTLPQGSTSVSYAADSGSGSLVVRWHNYYVGI